MDYAEYRGLIDDLLLANKTTGDKQSQSLVSFTQLNVQRMSRIDKTFQPTPGVLKRIKSVADQVSLLTLTDGWCGDAAQIVPVVEALTKATSIASRYLLRDENPAIMDQHLTQGGRSIPMVLILDKKSFHLLGCFGPRPSEPQEKAMTYKYMKAPKQPYSELTKELQLWYARDKQQAIQNELTEALLHSLQLER